MKSTRSADTKAEATDKMRELGMLPRWVVEEEAAMDTSGGQPKWGGKRFVNVDEFRRISRVTSSLEGIAAYFNVSVAFVQKLLKTKPAYRDAHLKGREDLKNIISIKQVEKAIAGKGDTVMLIWLGKNLLNQADQVKSEVKDTTEDDTKAEAATSIRAALDRMRSGPTKPDLGVVG